MINVDDRLIDEVMPEIGSDAFSVLFVITRHINTAKRAWPGITRIREKTKLSKERAYKAIKLLIDLGHVERTQENRKGEWGKVVYRVTSKYLSVFVPASHIELSSNEPLAGNPEYGNPEYAEPEYGNPEYRSIKQEEVLNTSKVLNIEEVSVDESTTIETRIGKKQFLLLSKVAVNGRRPDAEKFDLLLEFMEYVNGRRPAAEKFGLLLEFMEYRRQLGKPYKTEKGVTALLTTFGKYEIDVLRRAVAESIGKEYQGIFPEKHISPTTKQTSNGQANQPRHLVDEETFRKALARGHARGYK